MRSDGREQVEKKKKEKKNSKEERNRCVGVVVGIISAFAWMKGQAGRGFTRGWPVLRSEARLPRLSPCEFTVAVGDQRLSNGQDESKV